ncbi:MAG: macro domain-containing protein [Candidatus Odinarchaeota archaeon]
MNKLTFNDTTIEIAVNDIANAECDAIIIPTNSRLLPSGTIRCRVLRKAGSHVQVECNQIMQKISNIPMGEVVITSGGDLNSKFILHIRSGHDKKKLILAIWNSLKLADQKEDIKSICFPPLSLEVIGFNAQTCAELILKTIKKYILERNLNIRNISIYLETLPDYKEFEKILENLNK